MSLSTKAISAYREALRATGKAFQGDLNTLVAARHQIKSKMQLNEDPEDPSKSVEERIELLNSVSAFLKRNIVQGKKNDEDGRYFLKIHEDTELGDNDTIGGKNRKRKMTLGNPEAPVGGGCCGGGNTVLKERSS